MARRSTSTPSSFSAASSNTSCRTRCTRSGTTASTLALTRPRCASPTRCSQHRHYLIQRGRLRLSLVQRPSCPRLSCRAVPTAVSCSSAVLRPICERAHPPSPRCSCHDPLHHHPARARPRRLIDLPRVRVRPESSHHHQSYAHLRRRLPSPARFQRRQDSAQTLRPGAFAPESNTQIPIGRSERLLPPRRFGLVQ